MQVLYTITNNQCANTNNGSISIDNIIFTSEELVYFRDYIIEWTGDLETYQISENGRTASFLTNGIYTFQVQSLGLCFEGCEELLNGPIYTVSVTSPQSLVINYVRSKNYSCGNDAFIRVNISGGNPPYNYSIGNTNTLTSDTDLTINNLSYGDYSITITDANGCSVDFPDTISIAQSEPSITINDIIEPNILDSYGKLNFTASGDGPFSIMIHDNDNNTLVNTSYLDTTYLISNDNNNFTYYITDKIYPGEYTLTVMNSLGCSYSTSFIMSNINPIITSINVVKDTPLVGYNTILTQDIFDTIIIPYQQIIDNSDLWQAIQTYNLKDFIKFEINGENYQFRIVRSMGDKYCVSSNNIEILCLGNESKDWYYYLYIAPSIDLGINTDLINATIYIIHNDQKFPVILGLNESETLDSEQASLIRGSFILSSLGNGQFKSGGPLNVQIGIKEDLTLYDYKVNNITKTILKNVYGAGFVTLINFLEQFNVLNQVVGIGQTACSLSNSDYQYLLNIKNLLRSINHFNSIGEVYIYNLDNVKHNGRIDCYPRGNTRLYDEYNNIITNTYQIDYLAFQKNSKVPQDIYINNQIAQNINSIFNLADTHIIIKIKDTFENKTKFISFNNQIINYDDHYSTAIQYLEEYNYHMVPYFKYSDILVSTSPDNSTTHEIIQPSQAIIPSSNIITLNTINQTNNPTNTSLTIYINPSSLTCVLFGPKNYIKEFSQNTKFNNLVPGVYIIKGQDQDLLNKKLYQNENRVLVESGTDVSVNIQFNSYKDQAILVDRIV